MQNIKETNTMQENNFKTQICWVHIRTFREFLQLNNSLKSD